MVWILFVQSPQVWSKFFGKFDPDGIIQKHYTRWSENPSSKYYSTIHALRSSGLGDVDIKLHIQKQWLELGQQASAAGTVMHRRIELFLNGKLDAEFDSELSQFQRWLSNDIIPRGWRPFRTEWSIFDEEHMVAGVLAR